MDNQKLVNPYVRNIERATTANRAGHLDILSCSEFDMECRQRYGEKTCILYQLDKSQTYQVRVLDTCDVDDSPLHYTVEKSSFYVLIPRMLVKKYTVVIVDQVDRMKEVTAVHLPVQVQLTNPPIIQ